MSDTLEIGTVVVEVEPRDEVYAIERTRDLDIVRAIGPLDRHGPRDRDSLLAMLDDAKGEAASTGYWVDSYMQGESWCPASISSEVLVESRASRVTVVRSLDGVHRVEIFQNALGQYSSHQTRLVSNGRKFVAQHEWFVRTHEDQIELATRAVLDELEADAQDPSRSNDTVAPEAESRWQVTTEGQQFQADALREDVGSQLSSRACGHPTATGPCRNTISGNGPCAAGHNRS